MQDKKNGQKIVLHEFSLRGGGGDGGVVTKGTANPAGFKFLREATHHIALDSSSVLARRCCIVTRRRHNSAGKCFLREALAERQPPWGGGGGQSVSLSPTQSMFRSVVTAERAGHLSGVKNSDGYWVVCWMPTGT